MKRKKKPAESPAVDPVRAALAHHFGEAFVSRLSDDPAAVREVLPTGLSVLDHALFGIGGLPVGRAIEAYGGESAGKTTLSAHLIAGAQASGADVVLLDSERTFLQSRLVMVGGDPDRVTVFCPPTFEDAVEGISRTLAAHHRNTPLLVLWDSLAAGAPAGEMGEFMEEGDEKRVKKGLGDRARAMSEACRKWSGMLPASRCSLVVINQTRHKIGHFYGDPETTPGGDALKFFASIRLRLRHAGKLEGADESRGQKVKLMCVKNKLADPWQSAVYRLYYERGFDDDYAVRELAIERGLAKATGGYVVVGGEKYQARNVAAFAPALRSQLWPSDEG